MIARQLRLPLSIWIAGTIAVLMQGTVLVKFAMPVQSSR